MEMLCYNFSGGSNEYMTKYKESVGVLINEKDNNKNEIYDVYAYITYTPHMRTTPGPGGSATGVGEVCNPDPSMRLSITQAYGEGDCNKFRNEEGMEKIKDCTKPVRIAMTSEVMCW